MISAWFRLVRSKTFRVLPCMRTYLMIAAVLRLALCAVFLRSLSACASTHWLSYAVLHLAAVLRLV
jgi:hypothetical protein